MRIGKWVAATLACASLSATAAETYVGVTGRYERSDNINNSSTEEGSESEQVISPRLDATILAEGGRLEGAGTLYVEHADYRDDVFEDETLYNLVTSWTAELAENRLYWLLDDVAVREVVDARATDIAANRTDQNYLVTGPRINFGSGVRSQSWLAAQYSNYWYGDDAGIDSERYTGMGGFTHRLTPISNLGGRVEYTQTSFTEEGATDFERDEVALRYGRELERNNWNFEVGYNRVRPDELVDGEDREYAGPMGSFHWHQEWRPRVYTVVNFYSRLSDAGEQAVNDALQGGVDLDQTITTDIYRTTSGGLSAHREGRVWAVDLGVRGERARYESEPLDQNIGAIEFGLGRLVSPQTNFGIFLEAVRRDYLLLDRRDNDIEGTARLDHIFTSRFFGAVEVTHARRNSNESGADFKENLIMVEFGMRGALLARQRGAEMRDRGFGER